MPEVQIFPGVLSLILTRSARAGRTEIGGFLIGRVQGQKLFVTRATFPRQIGTSTHVAINDIDMALLAEDLIEQGTGEAIIGWWHTHPSLGVFMSGTDITTQERYQAFFPQAIALVVDPVKFSESLNLQDLDLHVYRIVEGRAKDLEFAYVFEPSEVIPDFYGLLLQLDIPSQIIFEDTWFERLLRNTLGERITTPEFTQHLGNFLEAIVAFSTVGVLMLIIILSLVALVS
ncbi:MAG: Mov34/MPN/PAD-1 family protein [Promethearchaeota archaeon]